jgi:hypothetical protein
VTGAGLPVVSTDSQHSSQQQALCFFENRNSLAVMIVVVNISKSKVWGTGTAVKDDYFHSYAA